MNSLSTIKHSNFQIILAHLDGSTWCKTTGTTGTTATTGTTPTTATTGTTAATVLQLLQVLLRLLGYSYYSTNSGGRWPGTFWAVLHQVLPHLEVFVSDSATVCVLILQIKESLYDRRDLSLEAESSISFYNNP